MLISDQFSRIYLTPDESFYHIDNHSTSVWDEIYTVYNDVINFNEKARMDIVNPVNNQNPASKKIHDADIQYRWRLRYMTYNLIHLVCHEFQNYNSLFNNII